MPKEREGQRKGGAERKQIKKRPNFKTSRARNLKFIVAINDPDILPAGDDAQWIERVGGREGFHLSCFHY